MEIPYLGMPPRSQLKQLKKQDDVVALCWTMIVRKLVPYCPLPWDIFNEVHRSFNNLVINYVCMINFLISKNRCIVPIWDELGLIQNCQINSLYKDARCGVHFMAFWKSTRFGLLLRFCFPIARLFAWTGIYMVVGVLKGRHFVYSNMQKTMKISRMFL